MKYLIIFLFAFCVGCKEKKPPANDRLLLAKACAETIFTVVELAEKGQITQEQLHSVADPAQHSLDSLRKLMTQTEIDSLDEFRTKYVSGMLDRMNK
jgi:hypothetical protein